jgi:dipeptidase
VPCYPDATVPARLARAGREPDGESPWWRMRSLRELVERDRARWTPVVRSRWDAFEAAVLEEAPRVEAEASRSPSRAAVLGAFMARVVDRYVAEAQALIAELSR